MLNWGMMTKAERDAAYNNSDAVKNSATLNDQRIAASAAFRAAQYPFMRLLIAFRCFAGIAMLSLLWLNYNCVSAKTAAISSRSFILPVHTRVTFPQLITCPLLVSLIVSRYVLYRV